MKFPTFLLNRAKDIPSSIFLYSYVRRIVFSDLVAIESLEKDLFPGNSYSERDLKTLLKKRKNKADGFVVEYQDQIVGYLIYKRQGDVLDLLRFGIHPDFRRQGLATRLIERLQRRLLSIGCDWILSEVSERHTEALILLRACGFSSVGMSKYPGEDDLTILMAHVHSEK